MFARVACIVGAVGCLASLAQAADSLVCAGCHRAIYDSFRRTPMAISSGPVGGAVPAESFANSAFAHAASGFRYRVSRSQGAYRMDFEKAGDAGVQGSKRLAYFIG